MNAIDAERIAAVCAAEPINTPGTIQPHGVLLAADPSSGYRIVAASGNAGTLITAFAGGEELLGLELTVLLGAPFAAEVRRRYETARLPGEAPWQSDLTLPDGGMLTAAVHASDSLIIVELESYREEEGFEALVVARALQERLAALQLAPADLAGLARCAAAGVRLLLGYERVVIYRFDPDWHGRVVAEDKTDQWHQSLDGLHFPASDIPAQARALYRRSRIRWVPDRDAVPAALVTDSSLKPGSIDLSFAKLRSLSPIHLQYHRNMGVNGSMSLSLLHRDQLWGLIVCHSREPYRPSSGQRVAGAVLADAFGLRVGPAEQADNEQARRGEMARLGDLFGRMADAETVTEALTTGDVTLLDLFGATGAAVIDNRVITLLGVTPDEAEVRALAGWLAAREDREKQFYTENLAGCFSGWRNLGIAAGLLAVFLTDDRSDMLLWFRPEEAQRVNWGGDPFKQAGAGEGAGLMPRQSFERWVEQRRGIARPWLDWEIEIADSLRNGITELVVRSLRRITELNDRLRQSQKMEAVGQLTAGIAHDFNNLLAAISGSLELMQLRIDRGQIGEVSRYIKGALDSVDRASSLVQRLMAFSRRQPLDAKPIDVGRTIAETEELIRGSVDSSISIRIRRADDLWPTLCDGNQLVGAILNLAINSRDAMPDGGALTIEVQNLRLDYRDPNNDLPAGDYVVLAITDTGIGMDPEVQARAFEPFYTTKALGVGTGLGLSMVYGFASQSKGHVGIVSQPGQGTTVRLYLPRYRGPEAVANRGNGLAAAPDVAAREGETILLVDDEATVRKVVGELLRGCGYRLIEAADGDQAITILQSSQPVDLLITDVGLPGGLNGRQLADAMRVDRPALKVLFITGYADYAAPRGDTPEPGTEVMTKPFALNALAAKVRAMMGP